MRKIFPAPSRGSKEKMLPSFNDFILTFLLSDHSLEVVGSEIILDRLSRFERNYPN